MSSGLLSMWLISGFLSISCCIWGLAMIMWRIRSGFDIISWTKGFSMICDSISGLDMSCLCICCCSSIKLAEPRPRLPRPRMPPKPAVGRRRVRVYLSNPSQIQQSLQVGSTCFSHIPFQSFPHLQKRDLYKGRGQAKHSIEQRETDPPPAFLHSPLYPGCAPPPHPNSIFPFAPELDSISEILETITN